MDKKDMILIQNHLKRVRKEKGLTYAQLAKLLDTSEPTVKRFFYSEDFSFSRLMEICSVLEVTLVDLVNSVSESSDKVFRLSIEQEREFAKSERLFSFFRILLYQKLTSAELSKKYRIKKTEIFEHLKKLDEMELLILSEANKYQLLVRGSHSWLPDGPLINTYGKSDLKKFVDHVFENRTQQDCVLTSSNRRLTPYHFRALQSDISDLAEKYRVLSHRDNQFNSEEDLIDVKWLLTATPYAQVREDELL